MLVNDHSSVILPTTQNRSAVVMAILHSIFFDCTTFEELIEDVLQSLFGFCIFSFKMHPCIFTLYMRLTGPREAWSSRRCCSPTLWSRPRHISYFFWWFHRTTRSFIRTSSVKSRHGPKSTSLCGMVFALDVVDNWRIKHPSEEIFLGPLTCKIQWYCICMSKELFNMVYKTANNSVHVMPEIIWQKKKLSFANRKKTSLSFFLDEGQFSAVCRLPWEIIPWDLGCAQFSRNSKSFYSPSWKRSFLHKILLFIPSWKLSIPHLLETMLCTLSLCFFFNMPFT